MNFRVNQCFEHNTFLCNASASATIDWQPQQQARTLAYQFNYKTTTKLSNPLKCQCQQSWLFFQWEECLAQVPGGDWLATIPHSRSVKGRDGSTLLPLEQDPLAGIRLPYDRRTGGTELNGKAPEHFVPAEVTRLVATIRSCHPDRSIDRLIKEDELTFSSIGSSILDISGGILHSGYKVER
jgi:hypothetical protein